MLTRRQFGFAGLAGFAKLSGLAIENPEHHENPENRENPENHENLEPRVSPLRGVFIILTTPFTASGEVDWQDLARETAFCDRCGVRGVVWPQGSSGVANLTKAERLRGM